MSSPPPTKPPRGVKQGKETSGLLMSVIRTLSASETNEQREKERAKLEKEYKKSDARLDELVAIHAQEIMDVMQKFTQVSEALNTWGTHSEAASARLAACRGLLRLRRDDLRRLWTDARTHHHALRMLTDISRVVVSERECAEALAAGRALGAAHTLRAALDTCRAALPAVSALQATTDHLQTKRRELLDLAVKRISGAVYAVEPAFTRRPSARRNAALLLSQLTKAGDIPDTYLQDITPEFEASLSEDDKTFETTVMISLEALAVMEQLKEAAEKFKVQIQTELLEVISTVSRRIIDEGDVEIDENNECEEEEGDMADTEGVTETGRPLARLVTCLGEEFRACGARNKRLLQLWKATMQKYQVSDTCLHTEQNYWSAVQQVLQLLLTEYLEIESVTLAASRASGGAGAATHELRLSDYFARKKPPRRQTKLFTLAAPLAASPRARAGGGGARRQGYPLVCRPRPAHLHAVLPALHALCADIETRAGGGECSLRAFITDYVRSGESERLASAARAAIEQAARAPAAWRERARHAGAGERARVIFAWCVAAWRAVRAAARAARRCGACGGALAAQAPHHAVAQLATACRHGHSRLCPAPGAGGGGGGGSRAARWLADDDIVRFLQSLPNWKLATADGHLPKTQAQELNQAYEREAEILGSSLGDGAVTREEIIADVNTLADLAVMCESMDWLSANIRTIPAIVSAPSAGGSVKLSEKYLNDISSAAMIFDEIAHKCLLMLHLELRIECFYYLGQEESDSSAGGAAQLAHALLAFHEQVQNVLAPTRLAYILNGLGEMMSAAVVWRWQEGRGGWEARLATLRHCLAALHLPHAGLHRAHAYLHLLSSTHEEIIASVREKGAQFSELEYLNAFKVLGARRGLSPADMRAHLKQLSAALGHVGVTV